MDGQDLFIGQVALQFEMFTGKQAPRELIRRIVQTELIRRAEGLRN